MESPATVSRLHLEEPHTFDRLHAMLKDYAKEKEAAESEKSIAMKRWDSAAEQNGTLDRQTTARRKHKEATELEVRSKYKRLCPKGELNFDKEKKRLEGLSRKLPPSEPATATEAASSSGSASKDSSTHQATSSSANADADRKRKTRDDLADGSDKKKRKKIQTKSIRDRPTKGPSDGVRGGGVS